MVPGFGAGKYQVAAWGAKKRLMQILESPSSKESNIPFQLDITLPKSDTLSKFNDYSAGDRFLHKFKVWGETLRKSDAHFFLHIDADASATESFSLKLLLDNLGEKSIGMVQQPKVLGQHPLGKKQLYDHYVKVSHKAINNVISPTSIQDFKYFNSGVVLFRRQSLENFLAWTSEILPIMPREIDGNMVADQDMLQVYANEIVPEEVKELDWKWNHCQWWDEDFPSPEAHIIHMSNFCQGPTAFQMGKLASLSRAEKVAGFHNLTVLLVTHNSGDILESSLAGLLEIPGLSILVVDNNSSTQPVPSANSKIEVIRNDENLGFAAAVNIGLLQVNTEFVCLLNPDAFLTYEVVEEAIEKLKENSNQILGPNYFDEFGNYTESLRFGYSMSRLIDDLIPNPKFLSRNLLGKVLGKRVGRNFYWLIGACIFSSSKFLKEIGGLNENYFLYMEDVELGMVASYRGDVQCLESPIVHLGQQSTDQPRSFILNQLAKARLLYLRRNYGFGAWLLTNIIYKSSIILGK
jgi:GT2 family glycosyltransferase